jgi:hypothetical protein
MDAKWVKILFKCLLTCNPTFLVGLLTQNLFCPCFMHKIVLGPLCEAAVPERRGRYGLRIVFTGATCCLEMLIPVFRRGQVHTSWLLLPVVILRSMPGSEDIQMWKDNDLNNKLFQNWGDCHLVPIPEGAKQINVPFRRSYNVGVTRTQTSKHGYMGI